DKLSELIKKPNIVAIGEIGLDKAKSVDFNVQTMVFKKQLELAANIKKPVILHCVKSFQEFYLEFANYPNNTYIFHDYAANFKIATQFLKYDVFFSFGKSLLMSKSKALDAFMNLPLERIFLETDNYEIDIKAIYKKAADLRGLSIQILKNKIFDNFEQIFKNK
ncbi:MAG: TatD family hydrolase, partial [Bacteroidales bacterium]|nr:TatD family hydrolase [Bacteroidales bacterium]